jgi:TPR repeat protein
MSASYRVLSVVLLLIGVAFGAARTAYAQSPLTTQGLDAFSAGRYADALEDWQQAANAGDGQAALYIGLMNDLGRGVAPDAEMARSWYERAAGLGNAVAMFNVGVLFDAGTGVERDRPLAADWYRKAAAKGMPRAAYALGLMHQAGDGVAADQNLARQYFRQALAGGVTAARSHLAALGDPAGAALPGKAETRDPGLAAFDQAQQLLLQRTPESAREAAALLRQAAERGNLLAAYNLGYCYDKGIGVGVDLQQAYVWYGRAAASPTTTVQRAAITGMQGVARRLDPVQLAAAKSTLARPGAR